MNRDGWATVAVTLKALNSSTPSPTPTAGITYVGFLNSGGTSQTVPSIFFFQAEDCIRDIGVTGVQTCALPIALETYIGCPFKFFAQYVLRLAEEPDDEEVMDPRTEGEFVHKVFETFFERWQADGHQAITPANLDTARTVFSEVVEDRLSALSQTEAALARTRLLGSPAAAGLGEAVLRMEAERPVAVVDRLLEHRLEGQFVFETPDGPRSIALRGK